MTLICFMTSVLAALNPTLLYDDNHDNENLWSRPSPGPLPVCSSLHPPGSRCYVCLWDQTIFAVCQNLSDGVKIMMEGLGRPIDLEKTACPQIITGDHRTWGLPLIIIFFILAVVVLAVVCWKRNNRANAGQQHQDDPL